MMPWMFGTVAPSIESLGLPVATAIVPWRWRSGMTATVVAKASLSLGMGSVATITQPEPIFVADQIFPHGRGSLWRASDLGVRLPQACVVLTGHAIPRDARPVPELAARLVVHRDVPLVDKTLYVRGDRSADGSVLPFSTMPLVYERALGGPSDERNPVGVGERQGDPAPNLIDARDPLRPACFGPIGPTWGARRHAGAPTATWSGGVLDLADAFDFAAFQPAPADQTMPMLNGNERIVLFGMSRAARIEAQLPDLRWTVTVESRGQLRRVLPFVVDTLIVDTDRMLCSVVGRADVPLRHAEELDRLRISVDLRAGKEDAQDRATMPLPDVALAASGSSEARAISARWANHEDADAARPLRALGTGVPAGAGPGAREATRTAPLAQAPPAPAADSFAAARDVLARWGSALDAPIGETTRTATPGTSRRRRVLPFSSPGLEEDALPPQATLTMSSVPPEQALPFRSEPPPPLPAMPPPLVISEGARFVQAPARLDQGAPPVLPPSTPASQAMAAVVIDVGAEARRKLDEMLRAKGSLDGADLSGADLRGVDLRGVSMVGADLRETDLRDAILAAAKLDRVDASAARFAGADLEGVSATKAVFVGADLTAAKLSRANFDRADLTRAVLTRVVADGIRMQDALAHGASFAGARLPDARFERTQLDASVLDDIDASGAHFDGATLVGAHARRARLERSSLGGALMRDADFSDATFDSASLREAQCDGATFDGASLRDAKLARLVGVGAKLRRIDGRNAQLRSATLQGADLAGATLAGAQLEDADLRDATLSAANLQRAGLRGARLGGADIAGADLSRADLREADLRGAKLDGCVTTDARAEGALVDRPLP